MKKIIAAIDGLKYAESVTEYAVYLAKQSGAYLVGIFLDDFTYHSYKMYEVIGDDQESLKRREVLEVQDRETREDSVRNFEKACQEAGLHFSVHHDRNIAMQELLHESIFADLLVINSKETLTHYQERIPTRFIRDLLSEVQCPVIVVPDEYKLIDKLILLYDGEPSSVYAIRTFSYLFPSLKQLDTEVISVQDKKPPGHVPDSRLMKEFMKRHYPKAQYTILNGVPDTEIAVHLDEEDRNAIIVLGAYRRGMVSRWFRHSMADKLMEELDVPLFIAHSK